MTSKQVTIRYDLHVELSAPVRTARQLVVVCHGYKSSSAHPALVAITKGLQNEGYATVTFNFSGRNPMDVQGQVADIHDVVTYFATKYSDIVLLAGSFGALGAAIAAPAGNIKGLITINGFFGSAQLGRKYRPTFWAFRLLATASPKHRRIWQFYRRNLKPEQIKKPTLVIHSKHDEMVSVRQSRTFFDKLSGQKRLVELDGTDHHLSSRAVTAQIVQEAAAWLAETAKSKQS